MKKCKYCQSDVDEKAKICPNCKKKQGNFFKKHPIITVLLVFLIIGIIATSTSGNNDSGSMQNNSNATSTSKNVVENNAIEYTKVDIDELEKALENNAAAAKDTYNGKYLEISGRLGTIDSDLKYISLLSSTDEWDIIGVHCTLKNQTSKDVVKSLSKDQNIIVKGKVTDVGEVLGYYLDVDEIIAQ